MWWSLGVYKFEIVGTKGLSMNKNTQASEIYPSTSKSKSPASRYAKKKVRIIKKICTEEGVWKFVSLDKVNNKYVWDTREGSYFLEWYDGKRNAANYGFDNQL